MVMIGFNELLAAVIWPPIVFGVPLILVSIMIRPMVGRIGR